MQNTQHIRPPAAPLFRDPIYDGAADPTIIWNHNEKSWWILYTNRRATDPSIGVSWVHGTDIGIASSTDGGQSWIYRGTVSGLEFEPGHNTFWAPEVIRFENQYHMYVSYVRGIPSTWGFGREIIHYTSDDLWNWKFESILELSSHMVIDACVFRHPEGLWNMWYKDEAHGSATYVAESNDLYQWQVRGPVITTPAHEGPNVFRWKGAYWLIADFWKGLMVWMSDDCSSWTRQSDILVTPGTRAEDGAYGHHADVLVQDGRAYIFYFTHPGERPAGSPDTDMTYEQKRTSLQVAELTIENRELSCRRDEPFDFHLRDGNEPA